MTRIKSNTPFNLQSVEQLMTRETIVIDRSAHLSEIARLFSENHFTHLPVVENEKLIGIVSLNDLLRANYIEDFGGEEEREMSVYDAIKTIDDIMTPNPTTISPQCTIKEAAQVMAQERFHSLPVVDPTTDEYLGLVTTTDIMNYLAEA